MKNRYNIYIYDDYNVDLYDNGVLDKSITDKRELENLLNWQDQQIKQSQIQLAIVKLEELKEEMYLHGTSYCEIRPSTVPCYPKDYAWFNYVMFRKFIDNKIKELKGEIDNESNK